MQVLTVNYLASDAPALFTKSLKETGFAVVNSHPINMSLVNDVYREWTEFLIQKINIVIYSKKKHKMAILQHCW
jgi:hypothetical protein